MIDGHERRKERKRAARKAELLAQKAAELGMDVEEYKNMEKKTKEGSLEADDVYKIMNFSKKDLDKFDEIFCRIDVDKSNFLSHDHKSYFTRS